MVARAIILYSGGRVLFQFSIFNRLSSLVLLKARLIERKTFKMDVPRAFLQNAVILSLSGLDPSYVFNAPEQVLAYNWPG